jgi:hypothetical protein
MRHAIKPLLTAVLVAASACQSATLGAPHGDIPATAVDETFGDAGVRRIAHAYYSGFDLPVRTVIDNQQDWAAAWATLYARQFPKPALPTVDFSHSAVIVAAMGTRGTGGYEITITRIARAGSVTWAEVTSASPGSRCGTTQALTQPVDMVVVPHTVVESAFAEVKIVRDC